MAKQFDASVIPKGAVFFKVYPNVLVSGAKLGDSGTSTNFTNASLLSYVDVPVEFYYGLTDSIMAGILLPVGYIKKTYPEEPDFSTTKLKNPWLIIKHQFWSEVVHAASSLRVKLPITGSEPLTDDIEPLTDGFDIEDKQLDIYPVYYLDWMMSLGTYIYGEIGYKYRMKSGNIKPSDELRVIVETGYAIVPDTLNMFTFSDFTKFFGSKINGEKDKLSSGYLYTIGMGVRFFLRRNLRVEVFSCANPLGKNQFRWLGGRVGVGYVFGM